MRGEKRTFRGGFLATHTFRAAIGPAQPHGVEALEATTGIEPV